MHLGRSLRVSALSIALLLASASSWAFVTVGISITVPPPVLPLYTQPPIPAPGYLWVPGYWAWADGGYYWVPGTWVEPPQADLLWTPGYWGWSDGIYVWNPGYWGPQVGFYGGVNYGFGYVGVGYAGGYWEHGAFFYNTAVNNTGGVRIAHAYNRAVINNITVNRVSYNGGAGGIKARPTAAQLAAARAPHRMAVAAQEQQERAASRNPQLRASANHGHPSIAATSRPGVFSGKGVVGARGAVAAAAVHPGTTHNAGPTRNVATEHKAAVNHNAPGRAAEVRSEPHPSGIEQSERGANAHAPSQPAIAERPAERPQEPQPHALNNAPNASPAHPPIRQAAAQPKRPPSKEPKEDHRPEGQPRP